jgi:hypothetical protein
MSCVVKGCQEPIRKRALMCSKHWDRLPKQLHETVRQGTEKGTHTLRAQPTREWIAATSKVVGDMRNLVFKVDAAGKVNRKMQNKVDEIAA